MAAPEKASQMLSAVGDSHTGEVAVLDTVILAVVELLAFFNVGGRVGCG